MRIRSLPNAPVRFRYGLPAFLLLGLWLPVAVIAQDSEEAPETTQVVFSATVELGFQRFSLPARQTISGPLFSLPPLAERLGGQLEVGAYGESYELRILDQELIFGPESPAVTSGERILRLSQTPMQSITGLLVPLDFLDETFGVGLGFRFQWDRETLTLRIDRPESRVLLVATELVHLQGATTLAFEFSEPPRYRIEKFPGLVFVEVRGDRLRPRGRVPSGDPLIRRVSIGDQRIRISLEAGAETQSYVLEDPFRLVFDVYQGSGTAEAREPARITRPRRRQGVHTIVIDPGHGGAETGAKSASGVHEKELTLILAKALRRKLLNRLPVEVVLTREGDEELALPTRTAIANQNKADLFISLHLNSSYGSKAHGAETYILSTEASDSQAAASAAAENAAGAAAGGGVDPLYDLQLILWDLSQSHYLAESLRFATLVQEELNQALKLRDRGVKQAPFQVLQGAAMPAVLVELGFLSNPAEDARLQDPEYRSQLVDSLVRAIIRYKSRSEFVPEPSPDKASAPAGAERP